jgi:nucleobase:cation symporter-1, NCS1 family
MIERVMSKNYAAITVSSNKETRKTHAAKANSPRVLVLPRRRNEHARRREIIVLKNRVPSRVLTRSVLVKNGNEDDDGDDGMIETFDSGKTSITMYNEDLAPVLMRNRSFGFIDLSALWIGLVVCVPAWTLVSSLMALGKVNAQIALILIFLANVLVLLPTCWQGAAGVKYGLPYVVQARASFGVKGANVAGLSRGLIASIWFGIQTVVGAKCLKTLFVDFGLIAASTVSTTNEFGGVIDFSLYGLFFLAQAFVVWNDVESIKTIEKFAAPVLLFLTLLLFVFTTTNSAFPSMFHAITQSFANNNVDVSFSWRTILQAATAAASFWATMIVNVSDFSRYSKSKKSFQSSSFAMPLTMLIFAFASIVVTSSASTILNTSSSLLTDPMVVTSQLSQHFGWGKISSVLAAIGILTATLSTNIAANILAPANALQNIAPSKLSFRTASILSMIIGTMCLPWKLTSDASSYVFVWLTGYGAFLAPILGIMLCDYFVLRKQKLNVTDLYSDDPKGEYYYQNGYNYRAIIAFTIGVLANLPGFLLATGFVPSTFEVPQIFSMAYDCAWFVGVFFGALAHLILSSIGQKN